MQYKKEAIRQKIIEVGKEEYLANGLRGGNIKVIADKAGVPVGNLYRYFSGKSGLLDAIVSPVYNEIPAIVEKLARLFISQNLTLHEAAPMLTDNALQMFEMYRSEILILVYGCANTPYEDFVDKLVGITGSLISVYLSEPPNEDQKEFIRLVSKSFITSLFELLRQDYPRDRLKELIGKLIEFTFNDINKRI